MLRSSTLRPLLCLAIGCACIAGASLTPAAQGPAAVQRGYVISGRVTDPHQLRPEGAELTLGHRDQDSFSSQPIPVGPDGSFVTSPLTPATYVLQVVRTPHSPTKPATTVGFTLIAVRASNVSDVNVEIRRDTALTGSFRMESDDPNPVWPPHIVVNAFLALDGMPLLDGTVAEGAAGGRFVVRNAFGPRVLRCGYTLAAGSKWWPSQVLLDGADITNVPTDFSTHENAHLEVGFTQHPARITGTVIDARGQPLRAPWILVSSADPALRQYWSTMNTVTQGNTRGEFSVPVSPGRYLVAALEQQIFSSYSRAQRDVLKLSSGGVPVEVKAREIKDIRVKVRDN